MATPDWDLLVIKVNDPLVCTPRLDHRTQSGLNPIAHLPRISPPVRSMAVYAFPAIPCTRLNVLVDDVGIPAQRVGVFLLRCG